jgi:hypothetical protein
MKIKENPDGSKELEGTAEELAEFEKRRRGEVKEDKKDKKKVLLKDTQDFGELIGKIVSDQLDKRQIKIVNLPHTCPITLPARTNPHETIEPWIVPYQTIPIKIEPWKYEITYRQ